MYKGKVHFSNENSCTIIQYKEYDTNADVQICASENELSIHRTSELVSHLRFVLKEKTINKLLSEFGTIEIMVYTHKYIKKENIIAVEYDTMQGDQVLDRYRIIWDIKEEAL